MTERPEPYRGDQPTPTAAEPMTPHWERQLRQWPRERITPATVARGLDSLLAELDTLRADRDRLTAENERLEGWGEATMEGCLGILVRAEQALSAVGEAIGVGPGASELLDELAEAVRQLSAGRR